MTRVTVVVLTYQSRRFVEECFSSLVRLDRTGLDVTLLAVDNGSSDGTPEAIRAGFPEVRVVATGQNLGFAGGCNVGLRLALEAGADFAYLLNPDTAVEPAFLVEAVAAAARHPEAGAVQSLLLLAEEPGLINTAGNRLHFLGLGFCGLYRAPRAAAPAEDAPIPFASGAAVLLRARALAEAGLLDEFLFLYGEDLDLGWRLRLAGWESLMAPRSVVRHHYAFSRNAGKLFLIERNRVYVLLKLLSPASLLLLAPLLLAGEVGLLAMAVAGGWAGAKLRAWGALLSPATWRQLRAGRARASAARRRPDPVVFDVMQPEIAFEGVSGGFVTRVANPLMRLAWRLWRPLLGVSASRGSAGRGR